MSFEVTLLVFGILLFLVGLVGKVKAKELEVGTSNKMARIIIAIAGLVLVALSFNPDLVKTVLSPTQEQTDTDTHTDKKNIDEEAEQERLAEEARREAAEEARREAAEEARREAAEEARRDAATAKPSNPCEPIRVPKGATCRDFYAERSNWDIGKIRNCGLYQVSRYKEALNIRSQSEWERFLSPCQ